MNANILNRDTILQERTFHLHFILQYVSAVAQTEPRALYYEQKHLLGDPERKKHGHQSGST